jgi:hypothetical protein
MKCKNCGEETDNIQVIYIMENIWTTICPYCENDDKENFKILELVDGLANSTIFDPFTNSIVQYFPDGTCQRVPIFELEVKRGYETAKHIITACREKYVMLKKGKRKFKYALKENAEYAMVYNNA